MCAASFTIETISHIFSNLLYKELLNFMLYETNNFILI